MTVEFKPCFKGCGANCPINQKESDICCNDARMCCYYCFEETCPIKEEYKEVIKTGVMES
jgi:hypothetical protein